MQQLTECMHRSHTQRVLVECDGTEETSCRAFVCATLCTLCSVAGEYSSSTSSCGGKAMEDMSVSNLFQGKGLSLLCHCVVSTSAVIFVPLTLFSHGLSVVITRTNRRSSVYRHDLLRGDSSWAMHQEDALCISCHTHTLSPVFSSASADRLQVPLLS